jgi:hypothetical protein
MAAISDYPLVGGPIIRGDPFSLPVDIRVQGVPVDVSDWIWRAHVRRSYDSALVTEFSIDIIIPEGGTVPSTVLMELDVFQTQLLKTGYVFDLEQLIDNSTPQTWRTWWIVERITVHKDVSHA